MKKLLLILPLLLSPLISSDTEIEKKIFESIFIELVKEEKPSVYSDSEIESLGLGSELFRQTQFCDEADIVVMTKSTLPLPCQKKLVFATRYRHLKNAFVIGAFFWQKGRPNIIFKKEQLHKHEISLSASLDEYVE